MNENKTKASRLNEIPSRQVKAMARFRLNHNYTGDFFAYNKDTK
jgi:hypothetical protein